MRIIESTLKARVHLGIAGDEGEAHPGEIGEGRRICAMVLAPRWGRGGGGSDQHNAATRRACLLVLCEDAVGVGRPHAAWRRRARGMRRGAQGLMPGRIPGW